MPLATVIERRDRALVCFAILSGARDDALASLAVKHVDLETRSVFQDARSVRTKNAKTFTSRFFPVDPLFAQVATEWLAELADAGFGPDDPLFPATSIEVGPDRRFVAAGLTHNFWASANPVRRIFKAAFVAAGFPYYNPHSFRKTLGIHCERLVRSAEEYRACSENFGHGSPMTTYVNYGSIAPYRQAEILDDLSRRGPSGAPAIEIETLTDEQAARLLKALADRLAGPRK
jgi:integrase